MKKLPIILGSAAIILTLIVYFLPSIKQTTYNITEDECKMLFSDTPQEFVNTKDEIKWTDDYCVSAKVKNANLILVLNEKQKEDWNINYDTAIDWAKQQGTDISSDFSKMTINTTKERVIDDVSISLMSVQSCIVKQFLNGKKASDAYVDVTIINKENNKILCQCTYALGTSPEIKSEDFIWD